MLLEETEEEQLLKKHQDLCSKLSLDLDTVQQAWDNFAKIKSSYTIEGDPLHWLGCAVFVACKKTTVQTVARNVIEGNCVNLTSLLRYCNLSLTQFFNKISKWVDMSHTPEDIRLKIKRLEGSFTVSYNVFKKFVPIFSEIFKGPIEAELMKQPRNRKQSIARAPPCTPTKVFEFCWILFTTVKGEIGSCSEDLVESYHLLQACCDLAFKNAFLDDRRDLLNPNFSELPSNWSDPNYIVPKEAPCIIEYLCQHHNGVSTDAKYVKEYSWKNRMRSLFSKTTLQGEEESFTKLFDPENFEANLKNITKRYEAYLLNNGDFDERIFLADLRRYLILKQRVFSLTYGDHLNLQTDITGDIILNDSFFNLGMSETPPGLSRMSGEGSKHASRLQALLVGRQAAPSETLVQIFHSCIHESMDRMKQVVAIMGEQFCREFTVQTPNVPAFTLDYAHQKLQQTTILFYRFVENIFYRERSQRRDISNLAQQDNFYQSMFACCLEIIMYCYNCQRKFPWILSALNIPPFYFVRVIELIVRLQEQLPRDAVKHLNMVEQKIIESLIWKTESPIWDALAKSGEDFPKFEDIALPGKMIYADKNSENISLRKITSELLSPVPSAVERFQSPINTDLKKQLFRVTPENKPCQFVMVEKDGIQQFLPLAEKQENVSDLELPMTTVLTYSKPKKTGSLSILLRKFYNLAYSRLDLLCNSLYITDLTLRQKIFTVFEYSVRGHTDLIRDRHLDQLLMCAVYVVCKVTDTRERKFAEIMEYYRTQPQAKSHVYRNVLIERSTDRTNVTEGMNSEHTTEKRGDLISFYNTIYIQVMRTFALQFSPNSTQKAGITLSPLPILMNNHIASPRFKITNNLFISSYDAPPNALAKGKTLEYHFTQSPSKDLERINSAISKSIIGKHILVDTDETEPSNKRVNKKFQSLYEERHRQICD